jgi:hypothetical protein
MKVAVLLFVLLAANVAVAEGSERLWHVVDKDSNLVAEVNLDFEFGSKVQLIKGLEARGHNVVDVDETDRIITISATDIMKAGIDAIESRRTWTLCNEVEDRCTQVDLMIFNPNPGAASLVAEKLIFFTATTEIQVIADEWERQALLTLVGALEKQCMQVLRSTPNKRRWILTATCSP